MRCSLVYHHFCVDKVYSYFLVVEEPNYIANMNKIVIAVVLLGLVVAAMAADDKMEKMRLKKEKMMAKKVRDSFKLNS